MTKTIVKGQQSATLSNMRQLQIATEQMAADGLAKENLNLGWPGDTGGSFSNWTHALVAEKYLGGFDLAKMLSAPGRPVSGEVAPTANTNGVLVYTAGAKSPGETVFLSTANFMNTPAGGRVDSKVKPYGKQGFVVFRRSGDGAVLQTRQARDTNAVGPLVPLCW